MNNISLKMRAIAPALLILMVSINTAAENGNNDDQEAVLKKRITSNANDYKALTELGKICRDRGDRKTALKLFKKAVKTAPDYPLAHFYLSKLLFVMQEYDEAVAELDTFKEKMKRLPSTDDETKKLYIDGLYFLSEVHFTLKDYPACIGVVEEILKLDPGEQEAQYNLGVCYYVYERSRSKAYQSFMKAIDLSPDTEIAKNARYAIEFMRNNPDSRVAPDFSFIDQEYRQ